MGFSRSVVLKGKGSSMLVGDADNYIHIAPILSPPRPAGRVGQGVRNQHLGQEVKISLRRPVRFDTPQPQCYTPLWSEPAQTGFAATNPRRGCAR